MEGLRSRNNRAGGLWFHTEQQITKELSRNIVGIFEIIYVIP